jgi:hypothetical protein
MARAKRTSTITVVLLLLLFGVSPARPQESAPGSGTVTETRSDSPAGVAMTAEYPANQPSGGTVTGISGGEGNTVQFEPLDPDQAGQDPQQSDPSAQFKSSPGVASQKHGFYEAWKEMADREEASEPNWLSPLATTSGRIKDELRYDIWRQTSPSGSAVSTFAGGKGLEFIAAPRIQLLLGIPSYVEHSAGKTPNGFGDLPLMVKFRISSASVSEGNYLVTFLLSATAPTGPPPNGAGAAVLTPTLAAGKGWGPFDVQTTLGGNLPAADTERLGRQLLWNTTFQYRAGWKLWPELEVNSTFYEQGPDQGKSQTFLTPGLGFGRAGLFRGVRFSMAGGMQIAVSQFHTYNHRWMFSMRFPF